MKSGICNTPYKKAFPDVTSAIQYAYRVRETYGTLQGVYKCNSGTHYHLSRSATKGVPRSERTYQKQINALVITEEDY